MKDALVILNILACFIGWILMVLGGLYFATMFACWFIDNIGSRYVRGADMIRLAMMVREERKAKRQPDRQY